MASVFTKRSGVEYIDAASTPIGASKRSVEDFGASVAEYLGRKPGLPVQPFVSQLGGQLEFSDTSKTVAGGYIIVHGPGEFGISLSNWTSPRRDQFTLAHELGHYYLHSKCGECPMIATRAGDGRSEWEANWFAAGFLMPRAEILRLIRVGKSSAQMASHFGVSPAAIEIRKKSVSE